MAPAGVLDLDVTTTPAQRAGHMPQLDSLRAFAVFSVMVHHFRGESRFGLPTGVMGVQLFFVLSGFLITGILLRAREAVHRGDQTASRAFQQFYIRRFLRIFPLFYMTLAVAWIVGVPDARNDLWWHASYMSNFHFAQLGYFTRYFAHFWSLAVEEQFYLVWPFVVILTPRRRLLPVLLAAAAAGPLYRLTGVWLGVQATGHWMWLLYTPFANVDSLAVGGLLAYTNQVDSDSSRRLQRALLRAGLWGGVPLAIGWCICRANGIRLPGRIGVEYTVWAFAFVWLIDRAARGFGGLPGTILEFTPLKYLGRISYGLYVFHLLMPDLVRETFRRFGWPDPSGDAAFALFVLVTILVASCSWHLYERPLNGLKERFASS